MVWSTDTIHGTALAVSAAHVLEDYFGHPAGVAIPLELTSPIDSPGKAVLRFADQDAGIPRTHVSPAMAGLKQLGDEQAQIPYDPQAEFILHGRTLEGMSGGGVFNQNGQLIGVIVRGTSKGAWPIVRCIRMTYIVEALASSYHGAHEELQKELLPFLDRSLLTEQE